jgi:potassium efflux system protein
LPTQHDLHASILQKFKELGIEISFPQRDLHLRSLPKELSDALNGASIRRAA